MRTPSWRVLSRTAEQNYHGDAETEEDPFEL